MPSSSSLAKRVSVQKEVHEGANGQGTHREYKVRVEVGVQAQEEEEVESVQRLLDGVPLEVQEAWICEDLMFALQVRTTRRASSIYHGANSRPTRCYGSNNQADDLGR
jgi:hypothetical protein